MIAYFDTSAVIPLLVEEAGSHRARQAWNGAERVVSARLLYPEARAALARAQRHDRITAADLYTCRRSLDRLVTQLDHVELTAELARRAGELAENLSLRGYDAVHLAAAETLVDPELVMVAGDADLCNAALALGLDVIKTSSDGGQ